MDKNSWLILFLKQFWIFWLILLLTILSIIPLYITIILYLLFCLYHRLTSTTELIYTKNCFMEEIIKNSNLSSYKFIPSFFLSNNPSPIFQFIPYKNSTKS